METKQIKVVLVGDRKVGKTSLVVSFAENRFPSDEYTLHVNDTYSVPTTVDSEMANLHICDIAGQEEFKRLRQMSYENADVFLLCFSLNCYHSFASIERLWLPEAREICPNSKFILIGTKSDLVGTGVCCSCSSSSSRKQQQPKRDKAAGKMTMTRTMKRMTSGMLHRMVRQVEEEEEEVRRKTGPTKTDIMNLLKKADGIIDCYLECSAKTEKNSQDVFSKAVRVVRLNEKMKKREKKGKLEYFVERHHCALL